MNEVIKINSRVIIKGVYMKTKVGSCEVEFPVRHMLHQFLRTFLVFLWTDNSRIEYFAISNFLRRYQSIV